MKHVILLLCCSFFLLSGRAQYFDTLVLHYDIGAATLNGNDKMLLDSVVKNFGNKRLLIYGHADYLGTEDPNQLLSEQRAKKAAEYLVSKGFEEKRIMQCAGAGQIKGNGDKQGDPESRRTDIFIIREKPGIPAPQRKPAEIRTNQTTETIADVRYEDIKVGDTIDLKNIEFITGEVIITRASYPEVDKLYRIMRDHPTLKIQLEGHVCCCIYPDGYFPDTPHWILSVERAKKIYSMLIHKGIAAERLSYKGFGRTRPIRDHEETIEQGQVNRRVEVRILAK
jgi:outer membrane protein OmpA-like peptidoglycan-associated protein